MLFVFQEIYGLLETVLKYHFLICFLLCVTFLAYMFRLIINFKLISDFVVRYKFRFFFFPNIYTLALEPYNFPGGTVVNKPPANAKDTRVTSLIPEWGKIPWNLKWQPTLVFLLENSMDRRP